MPLLVLTLPPAALRVNAQKGRNWTRYHAAAKKYRETIGNEALVQEAQWRGVEIVYPVRVDVWLCLTGKGKADPWDAGTWCKAMIDELVAMGVWPDDSDEYTNPIKIGIERVKRNPRVEVRWADKDGRV